MLFKELPLSSPMFCVALGAVVFAIPGVPGVAPHPQDHLKITERLTELIVIVSLTGAGLKVDIPMAWKSCWSAVGLVVLISVVLHGATVTPVMRHLDQRK